MTWIILSCKCLTMASRKYLFHDHPRYRGEAHQMVVPQVFSSFPNKMGKTSPFLQSAGTSLLEKWWVSDEWLGDQISQFPHHTGIHVLWSYRLMHIQLHEKGPDLLHPYSTRILLAQSLLRGLGT